MNQKELLEVISKASFTQDQLTAVNALVTKVLQLEEKVKSLEGVLATPKHVSTMLQIQLDNQEAYSRRPCLVVSGVDSNLKEKELQDEMVNIISKTTNAEKSEVINNIDKMHGIGVDQIRKKKKKKIIIKFKTHSYKEKVYKQRKNINNHTIKFRPSMTKRRQDLLEEVNNHIKDSSEPNFPVEFAFSDVHGNLKVLMKEGVTPRFQSFNTIIEYYGILNKVNFTQPYEDYGNE